MTDGGPASCKGTTILPLCIGSKTYYHHVLIAEIEAPFVLGYDIFIRQAVLFRYLERESTQPRQVNPVQTGE